MRGPALERQGQLIEQPNNAQEVGVVDAEVIVAGVEHSAFEVNPHTITEAEPDRHGARPVGLDAPFGGLDVPRGGVERLLGARGGGE